MTGELAKTPPNANTDVIVAAVCPKRTRRKGRYELPLCVSQMHGLSKSLTHLNGFSLDIMLGFSVWTCGCAVVLFCPASS